MVWKGIPSLVNSLSFRRRAEKQFLFYGAQPAVVDNTEEFITDFTKYMQQQYSDLSSLMNENLRKMA